MKHSKVVVIATAWAASLVSVGLLAQGGRGADVQVQPAPFVVTDSLAPRPVGDVITGENFGFQPVAAVPSRDGRIAGYFVVKVNGQWVEVTSAVRVIR